MVLEGVSQGQKGQCLHSGGGCTIQKEGGRVMRLSFFKPPGLESVTRAEFDLMQRIEPHLRRAAQLRRHFGKVELKARWASDALDRLSVGVMLLDDRGRIVFMDSLAGEILHRSRLL